MTNTNTDDMNRDELAAALRECRAKLSAARVALGGSPYDCDECHDGLLCKYGTCDDCGSGARIEGCEARRMRSRMVAAIQALEA